MTTAVHGAGALRVPGNVAPPAVELWLVALDLDDDALVAARRLLTPAERARADRGVPEVRRRRIALRAALRTVTGAALRVTAALVPLRSGPHGRPDLGVPGLDVSASASWPLGLIALGRGLRVGVDLERVAPWSESTTGEGWLSDAEVDGLRAQPPAARARAAAQLWTCKEAVLKATGAGLTRPPVSVPVDPDRPWGEVAGWTVSPVVVPPGHVATLASSAPLGHLERPLLPRHLPPTFDVQDGKP